MRHRRDHLLLLAFVLSGMAGLGYEILWTRLLPLALGTEARAVIGVLVGFFAGMALGAALLDGRIRRSRNPVAWFIGLELVAAAYAILSPYFIRELTTALPIALGPTMLQGSPVRALSFTVAITAACLLPGTVPMGATLACLVEARRRVHARESHGRSVGRLYAANTAGATLGILIAVHWILPSLGMAWGAAGLAALGGAAAALAWVWSRGQSMQADPAALATPDVDCSGDPDSKLLSEPWVIYVLLAATGFIGIGLEVVGVQVLAQVFTNTVFAFADMLAVYLIGTAGGSWIYARFATRAVARRPATITGILLLGHGLAAAGSAWTLRAAPATLPWIASQGSGYAGLLLAEFAVAATVFLLPTLLMGALFAHLVGLVTHRGVGKAYAANTLGASLAPAVFGLWLMPAIEYAEAFYLNVYLYLGAFCLFGWCRRFPWSWQVAAVAMVLVATVLSPRSLGLVPVAEGWTALKRSEGPYGAVLVTENRASGERRLQVNHRFRMGSSRDLGVKRLGHIPLLLARDPSRALFLGIGTGTTLSAVDSFPGLHADGVELVPEIVAYLPYFGDINQRVYDHPRIEIHVSDARRFLAASQQSYDVIVADLFHPARDGAGFLYSRELFALAHDHLTERGLFAQWLPLHQFDEPVLKSVLRTFVDVFPAAHSFLGLHQARTPLLALIGTRESGPLEIDLNVLRKQLLRPEYQKLGMPDARALVAAYMLDAEALREYAGAAPLNTDFHPRVLFEAPRGTYERRRGRGPVNLSALLSVQRRNPPNLVVGASSAPDFRRRSEMYWKAGRWYLRGEIVRSLSGRRDRPPQAAIEAYLNAYRSEPEFMPAKTELLDLARSHRSLTRRILEGMLERTPDDPTLRAAHRRYLRSAGERTAPGETPGGRGFHRGAPRLQF